MQQTLSLRLTPADAANEAAILQQAARKCAVPLSDIRGYSITKRSIDARGKSVFIQLSLLLYIKEPAPAPEKNPFTFRDVRQSKYSVVIVGSGPAGLFAALRLLEAGIRPIIIERGKDVRSRRRDLAILNKEGIIHPESNYCFGEGGAGTYSDGKLYTRSNKRGDINRILRLFVHFGAPETILYDAHPHIGTNKLPQIITSMREQILACGGEVWFEHKLTNLQVDRGQITSVTTSNGHVLKANAIILATGHSARDIFELLHQKGIRIEAKPFALGVRVEHPQSLIDNIQYHCDNRGPYLPPASYSLVQQVNGLGVFSFCMCPGGIIAPASTAPGEIVVNGWSPSKRNNPFANSGMVVAINAEHALRSLQKSMENADDPFLFMDFQKMVEQKAFMAGGGGATAPAQRMVDFAEGRHSNSLPDHSYLPGLNSADLRQVLPDFVYESLARGFRAFGKRMKGYFSNEALVVATESRTSSPVRIPRDPELYHHPQINNLYPCGEGAGYAGGIVSAAMDGEKVAEVIRQVLIRS